MKNRCVIIAAAPNPETGFIRQSIKESDFVICADAGYEAAFKAGITPELIVGDFDSAQKPETELPMITLPVHKDDTDTVFAVKEGLKRGFRQFLLLGALGGRVDHTFANFSVLEYLHQNGAHGLICDSRVQICFTAGETCTFRGKTGQTLSVFPYGCESCTVTHHGFEYELAQQEIFSSFPLGISNVIKSDTASIEFHDGKALVMLFAEKSAHL